jgi:hypothetical protein
MRADESDSRGRGVGADALRTRSRGPIAWFLNLSWTGRAVVSGAILLAAVCILFVEENWRGRRAWESCRRELEAKGALDWEKFVPEPVADDQNFATTTFLAPLFDLNPRPRTGGQSPWRDLEGHDRAVRFAAVLLPTNKKGELPPARFDGRFTDLDRALSLLGSQTNQAADTKPAPAFSSRAEAASALLFAVQGFKPVLEELRTASQRPRSRFNIEYDAEDPVTILLPHYIVLQHISHLLEVRASAELELSQTDAAFQDVDFMFRLADSIKEEPFMIGVAVRGSLTKRAEQIIWEGLAKRLWQEGQLQKFQERLAHYRPLNELDRGLRAERAAFGGKTFKYLRGHKHELRLWLGSPEARPLMYLMAGPEGWFYQEQVSYHRFHDQRVLPGFAPESGHVQPRVIDTNQKALEKELQGSPVWHHTGFSMLIFSNVMKAFQRTAVGQDCANQTMTACALERYRLAFGKYPANADDLVPRFVNTVPLDVCDGKPLKYRVRPEGQFLLYSVGWNEQDDGGMAFFKPGGSDTDPNKGDWVWPWYSKSLTNNEKIASQ